MTPSRRSRRTLFGTRARAPEKNASNARPPRVSGGATNPPTRGRRVPRRRRRSRARAAVSGNASAAPKARKRRGSRADARKCFRKHLRKLSRVGPRRATRRGRRTPPRDDEPVPSRFAPVVGAGIGSSSLESGAGVLSRPSPAPLSFDEIGTDVARACVRNERRSRGDQTALSRPAAFLCFDDPRLHGRAKNAGRDDPRASSLAEDGIPPWGLSRGHRAVCITARGSEPRLGSRS